MPYCTLQDLTDRYGTRELVALTDRDGSTNDIDNAVVDRAIADADAVINGYLAGRYQMPLNAVPELIATMSGVLAFANLHIFDTPEKVEKDKAEVLSQLRDIARGMITLDVAGVEPKTSGGSGVMTTDRARPLTAAGLKGFI